MKIKALLHGFFLLVTAIILRAADVAPKESPLFLTVKDFESIDDHLFPLGWSADGKFAWICQQSNEAADECTWLFTIKHMGTNKVVATEKFEMADKPENGITKLWAAHGKAITVLLTKHAIKRTSPVMDHFPVVLGKRRGVVFQPMLETVTGQHDLMFTGVKSLQLTLDSEDKKAVVFQKKYDGYLFPFAVALTGCFVSPDEAHAAVVITGCWRGYEGAPHPRKIEALAGCKTGLGD